MKNGSLSDLGYPALSDRIEAFLASTGLAPEQVEWMGLLIGIVLIFVVMAALSRILAIVLTRGLRHVSKRTTNRFDDHLVQFKVPRYVARIFPLMLSYRLVPLVLAEHPDLSQLVTRLFHIFFIVLFVRIIMATLRAGRDALKGLPVFRDKPLDSYLQVISLVLHLIAGILIFSQLTGRSALTFITAMGAASAVMLLIFKDTILGFVASIQISANDMVRMGDWITMSKYGADGDVFEINLTTVKVLNWDKTITTIPTYALISDSFQNWRAMAESGGRRIKRSIHIKISSIRHLTEAAIDTLRSVQLLTPYIDERRAEIRAYNAENNVDESNLVNGRRLTNAGLYRKYMELYLAAHPGIHQGMTRMVRQLAPNENGLPLELYCFSNDTQWEAYENIISDIFDHLLASHEVFRVEISETPSGADLRSVSTALLAARGM